MAKLEWRNAGTTAWLAVSTVPRNGHGPVAWVIVTNVDGMQETSLVGEEWIKYGGNRMAGEVEFATLDAAQRHCQAIEDELLLIAEEAAKQSTSPAELQWEYFTNQLGAHWEAKSAVPTGSTSPAVTATWAIYIWKDGTFRLCVIGSDKLRRLLEEQETRFETLQAAQARCQELERAMLPRAKGPEGNTPKYELRWRRGELSDLVAETQLDGEYEDPFWRIDCCDGTYSLSASSPDLRALLKFVYHSTLDNAKQACQDAEDRIREGQAVMADIEQQHERHHEQCYGRKSSKWRWCAVEHPGIWAYGGLEPSPCFKHARWRVPPEEPVYAWRAYIGPKPVIDGIEGTEDE